MVSAIPSKAAIAHANKVYDMGQRIAIVRDIALALELDAEVVADIQRHYADRKIQLNFLQQEMGK